MRILGDIFMQILRYISFQIFIVLMISDLSYPNDKTKILRNQKCQSGPYLICGTIRRIIRTQFLNYQNII